MKEIIEKIKILIKEIEKNTLGVLESLNAIKKMIEKDDKQITQEKSDYICSLIGEINVKRFNIEMYLQSATEKVKNITVKDGE